MRKLVPYIICAAALICSCSSGSDVSLDEAVAGTSDILLKVNGSYIRFDENEMQFCSGARLFRAGNDDMSSYFSLTFDRYPSSEKESVSADLKWKNGGAAQERNSLKLTVAKVEGDVLWLSGDGGKINAVIRKI